MISRRKLIFLSSVIALGLVTGALITAAPLPAESYKQEGCQLFQELLATIASGFVGIVLGGNLVWTAIAVVAGCAFGTFFMAFHSTQGPQLGLPQMIQSRPQFGYVGALLVWCVALITFIGYCAFNQVLSADTIRRAASVYSCRTARRPDQRQPARCGCARRAPGSVP